MMPSTSESVMPTTRAEASRHSGDWVSRLTGRWHVLHTRSRAEKVVSEALTRKNVQHYLPLVSVHRTYPKRRVTFRLPLFPGYVFLCGDHADREAALKTNRVVSVIEVDNQDQLRSELARVCRVVESVEDVDVCPPLTTGQFCRVTGGPLSGLEGIVLRQGRKWRMHISVTILNQAATIEIDAAQLEAIGDSADDRDLTRQPRIHSSNVV